MPIYEYRCQSCHRRVELFFRSFNPSEAPQCPRCGSAALTRLVSPVAMLRQAAESLGPSDSLLDPQVDENDPQAMKRWIKDVKRELGDEAPELDELDLLDAGVSPDDEEAMDEGDDLA